MTTLQRSSYSFRRQGSSGRIWDSGHEPRSATGRDKSRELIHPQIPSPGPPMVHPPLPDSKELRAPPASRSEEKVSRCGFDCLLGRCFRSSPAN